MASVASAQKRAAPRPVKPLPPGTVINYLSPRTGEVNAEGSPRAPAERRVPAARAVPHSQQTAQQSEKSPPGTLGFRVKVQDVPGRTAEAVQPAESCCFPDGTCLTFPGCALKGGTPVEMCQGDNNGNGIDDACEGGCTTNADCDDDRGCTSDVCDNKVCVNDPGSCPEPGTKHESYACPGVCAECEEEEVAYMAHMGDGSAIDPVYFFSGEFYYSAVDLRIAGRMMDFVWGRKYRSKIGPNTAQGNGGRAHVLRALA